MKIRSIMMEDKDQFFDLEAMIFPDDQVSKDEFGGSVSNPGFYGLFDDESLIGYLILTLQEGYGHLNRIGVHPDHQGKGYGSKLMEYALDYFSDHDVQEVSLYVRTSNDVAVELYKKYDFFIETESWEYIVDLSRLDENLAIGPSEMAIREVRSGMIDKIAATFENVNEVVLRSWIDKRKKSGSTLRYLVAFVDNNLVIFARFSPSFSGCKPFEFIDNRYVFPFLEKMKHNYVQEDKDTLRLTFDGHKELAEKFDEQGHTQYYHLYKMVLTLS